MSQLTFKDLKKRINLTAQQQSRLFERLQNKPFWIWDIEEHKQEDIKTKGSCCFNHVIGLPQKNAIDKTLCSGLWPGYVRKIMHYQVHKCA